MRELIKFMVRVRKEKKLFSIQEAAFHCKCSEMTIRNFENCANNSSGNILCFYIAEIVFKCDDSIQQELLYLIKEARGDVV